MKKILKSEGVVAEPEYFGRSDEKPPEDLKSFDKKSMKWVLHVDGDAFFASCEVSRRPDLFGKPVVVGEERGIATALTYTAKALGVKRGDPIWKIRREYPQITVLSSHFELYRKFAKNLESILRLYLDEFEAYSIDECFGIISGTPDEVKDKVIKCSREVKSKLGVTYSFGVSINKTLAKLASKRNKPEGVCFLFSAESINVVLKTTDAKDVWGIGYATQKKLNLHKIKTAWNFANMDIRNTLKDVSSPLYQTQEELLGRVNFEVGHSNPHQKSLQSTRTFIKKTNNMTEIFSELSRNVENACSELYASRLYTNKIFFYIKAKEKGQKSIYEDFYLPNYTQSPQVVLKQIEHLFGKYKSVSSCIYKSSGVILSNLEFKEDIQDDLFQTQSKTMEDENKINITINSIRNKFGFGSVQLGASLNSNIKRNIEMEKRDKKDNYEYGLPYPFMGVTN